MPTITVGQENNVEALCLMAAMALSTHQAWNYMSSNGVFWNGSISTMPGFYEVPRVASVVPRDIGNGWDIFHGGERFRDKRILVANSTGTLRCDHMLNGNQFQVIAYGTQGTWSIPVSRSFDGVIIRPATLQQEPVARSGGGVLDISFERGFILQGKLT